MYLIFISCLGLLGLATFATERRQKEIGVRKVLGASTTSIISLLSKDFLKLVLVAIIIATPLAYYGMNRWLQDFHFRIDIPWWIFILSGILAISVAFLTIGFQSFKAATLNPVKAISDQ